MTKSDLGIGDIVRIEKGEWAGYIGIVSKPVTGQQTGHVLVYGSGYIQGLPVSLAEVSPAEKASKGYAQLAYNLIKLGSKVIEQGLL
jgi:hypothetical protein